LNVVGAEPLTCYMMVAMSKNEKEGEEEKKSEAAIRVQTC
jgi:hypothetical protein